jgi:hypothetical protein
LASIGVAAALVSGVTAGTLALSTAPAWATQIFTAHLVGAQEVPPTASAATGIGFVTLNDTETAITVDESWSGLSSAATASHIHGPAAAGTNAPVLLPFTGVPAATSGSIPEQTFAVTPAQVAQLKGGLFYMNVHSATFPGGEIRGQLAASTAPACTTTLTGDVTGPVVVGSGQSVCVVNARVTGGITVSGGGSLSVTGSRISGGIAATGPGFVSVCGSQVTSSAASPGQAVAVSGATGTVRLGDPAVGCAGNQVAGALTLTGNAGGVTAGSNTVSGTITVNNNTPGPTVLKANNSFVALSCSGNNPAPTNAGQANTAPSKTGQCAAL